MKNYNISLRLGLTENWNYSFLSQKNYFQNNIYSSLLLKKIEDLFYFLFKKSGRNVFLFFHSIIIQKYTYYLLYHLNFFFLGKRYAEQTSSAYFLQNYISKWRGRIGKVFTHRLLYKCLNVFAKQMPRAVLGKESVRVLFLRNILVQLRLRRRKLISKKRVRKNGNLNQPFSRSNRFRGKLNGGKRYLSQFIAILNYAKYDSVVGRLRKKKINPNKDKIINNFALKQIFFRLPRTTFFKRAASITKDFAYKNRRKTSLKKKLTLKMKMRRLRKNSPHLFRKLLLKQQRKLKFHRKSSVSKFLKIRNTKSRRLREEMRKKKYWQFKQKLGLIARYKKVLHKLPLSKSVRGKRLKRLRLKINKLVVRLDLKFKLRVKKLRASKLQKIKTLRLRNSSLYYNAYLELSHNPRSIPFLFQFFYHHFTRMTSLTLLLKPLLIEFIRFQEVGQGEKLKAQIKFNIITLQKFNAEFISNIIRVRLANKQYVNEVIFPLARDFYNKSYGLFKGIKIQLRGRFSRVQRAQKRVTSYGFISVKNYKSNITYWNSAARLRNSVVGIKVSLNVSAAYKLKEWCYYYLTR